MMPNVMLDSWSNIDSSDSHRNLLLDEPSPLDAIQYYLSEFSGFQISRNVPVTVQVASSLDEA